jgi:hypothetical protein
MLKYLKNTKHKSCQLTYVLGVHDLFGTELAMTI